MTRAAQDTDPFDSYMAARLAKPVAQVTAALDADDDDESCPRCHRVNWGQTPDGDLECVSCWYVIKRDPFDGPAHITPEREAQAHADLIAALPPRTCPEHRGALEACEPVHEARYHAEMAEGTR